MGWWGECSLRSQANLGLRTGSATGGRVSSQTAAHLWASVSLLRNDTGTHLLDRPLRIRHGNIGEALSTGPGTCRC